jgi:glycopeptide antibiotics resistance protein
MLHQLAKPALIVLAISSFLWIIYRIILFSGKNKQASSKREMTLFFFVAWVVFVLLLTLYPLPITRIKVPGAKGINFIPVENTLKEFSETLSKKRSFMRSHSMENIIGNFFLFVPLGIFLPLISKRFNSFIKIFLFGLLFSLSLETLQWISRQYGVYRSVDVDDVILNVMGIVGGFIIVRLFHKKTWEH